MSLDANVMDIFRQYSDARRRFLATISRTTSNRDPLSEFSEWLVAQLVGGTLATSRTQPHWDVKTSDGRHIQVKYLANSRPENQTDVKWINEHEIKVTGNMTHYAIVFFEDLQPETVIVFPVNSLQKIGKKLKKQHGNLDTTLKLTQKNYKMIIEDREQEFHGLGVEVYLLDRIYPIGYFEETYGSMADDPIERGEQPPIDVRDEIE